MYAITYRHILDIIFKTRRKVSNEYTWKYNRIEAIREKIVTLSTLAAMNKLLLNFYHRSRRKEYLIIEDHTRIKRAPWILIDEENKMHEKENILVPTFMQIDSLTMSAGKMRTASKTYVVSMPSPIIPQFFYIVLLFLLFTPFPTFFLLLSLCLSLRHARISLRPIEHHRKKRRDSFDNFPLWKGLSRTR